MERFAYEDEGGIAGTVDGKAIYIGSRALLMNHGIEAPAREEETQYTSGNKSVIYIARDNAIAALLVLTYAADRRRKNGSSGWRTAASACWCAPPTPT